MSTGCSTTTSRSRVPFRSRRKLSPSAPIVLAAAIVFDERYPIFFNDVQLARSLAAQGHALWVTPDAVVVHEAHASAPKCSSERGVGSTSALVRMLEETEPLYQVWLYRAVVLVENLALWALDRPEALRGHHLLAALAGNPGPPSDSPLSRRHRLARERVLETRGCAAPLLSQELGRYLRRRGWLCGMRVMRRHGVSTIERR